MSAETLRKAAALMRERAEAATDGPWLAFTAKRGAGYVHGVTTDLDVDYDSDLFVGSTQRDAIHVASWHPAAALAVADWLESVAGAMTSPDENVRDAGRTIAHQDEDAAIAVARTYLGESA